MRSTGDNDQGERLIRLAVTNRMNSYCNNRDRGILNRAMLMNVFRTLHRRVYNPIDVLLEEPESYRRFHGQQL